MPQINLQKNQSAIMFFVAGICLGFFFGSLAKNQAYKSGLEAGKLEIEEKYQQKIAEIFPLIPEPEQIFSGLGKIVGIEGNVLILEQTIYTVNPFEEPAVRKWQVKVIDSTKLVKRIDKTLEEMAKEMEMSKEPLSPFKELNIKFSDFQIGQEIIAESEENIKGKIEFEAKKVILIPVLIMP